MEQPTNNILIRTKKEITHRWDTYEERTEHHLNLIKGGKSYDEANEILTKSYRANLKLDTLNKLIAEFGCLETLELTTFIEIIKELLNDR